VKRGSGVTQKEIKAELEDIQLSTEALAAKLPPGKPRVGLNRGDLPPRRNNLPKEVDRKERTITVQWFCKGTCAYCGKNDAHRKTLVVGEGPYARQGVPKPEQYKFICESCEHDPVPKPKAKRKHVTAKKRGMNAEDSDEDD